MIHKEDTWGWMLATDFFCAGMGGGMLVVAGLVELFLGPGRTSLLANILAPLLVAAGAGLLILELGRPLQAWRVFVNPKAILTFGAWNMTLAIGFGLAYASFGIPALPWSGWAGAVRQILALLATATGLVVAGYPGVLLARHKSRPFWTGPGMLAIFLICSLVTASAGHLLSGMLLRPSQAGLQSALPFITVDLLIFQLIFWPAYLWIKSSGTTAREAAAAQLWLRGKFARAFWLGILLAGTLLPLILLPLPGAALQALGGVLALAGGLLIRLLVVYSGAVRTWMPGEEKYRSRLPLGDEDFLKILK
jgi:formate-dependent nitrite reductase membrane component NrfD